MKLETPELVLASFVIGAVSHPVFRLYEPESIGSFLLLIFTAGTFQSTILSFTINQTIISVSVFLFALGIAILYYRIASHRHPLHHIPGPLIARLTQIHLFFSLLRGRPRIDQRILHDKYGPIVRIGPNEVSIADTTALNAIYGGKSWEKGKSYSFTASGGAATSETALSSIRDHKVHSFRRKIWDRAFSIAALKNYQPSIELRTQQLCDQLDRLDTDNIIDLQEWISYLVFDIMTDLAWGGGGATLTKGYDSDGAIESLKYSLHLAGMTKALPWFAQVLASLPWIRKRTKKFHSFARDMFLARKEKGESRPDKAGSDVFYHLLGEGTEDGRLISMGALQADSRQVVTGGADTTVSAITYLFYHLACSPNHYKLLQSHIDSLAQNTPVGTLTYESVQKSEYLDAYIYEAMRLEPPIPFQNQRIVPSPGVWFSDVFLPAGTYIRTALYTISRSPLNFYPGPESFRPERWIPSLRATGEIFNARASSPFLLGPYHCVGRNFAMAEMRWTVARLVQRYNMRLEENFSKEKFERSIEDRSVLEITEKLSLIIERR